MEHSKEGPQGPPQQSLPVCVCEIYMRARVPERVESVVNQWGADMMGQSMCWLSMCVFGRMAKIVF